MMPDFISYYGALTLLLFPYLYSQIKCVAERFQKFNWKAADVINLGYRFEFFWHTSYIYIYMDVCTYLYSHTF